MGDETIEERILAAVVRCVARWGVAKTTLDDVAREAGCSRATVYRAVPGGRDVLLLAAADRELRAVEASIAARLDTAGDLADALAIATCEGSRAVRQHPALAYLVEHEPEHVLPWVSFDELDPLLARVAEFTRPWIIERLPDGAPADLADEVGELIGRLVVSYALDPSEHLDPTDPDDARRLIDTYVLPGIDDALGVQPTGAPA